MDKREVWFAGVLIAIGIGGFIYSVLLPTMGPIALSPGLFPGVVTVLMIILGGVWLFKLLRLKDEIAEDKDAGEKRSFLMTMGLFLVYLLLLVYVHFIASTVIFLFLAMLYLHKRFHWKIPVISVATALGIFYLFRYLLNVRLP